MFLDKIAESTHKFLLRISGVAFSFMMIFILINLLFAKNIQYSEFHRRGFVLAINRFESQGLFSDRFQGLME